MLNAKVKAMRTNANAKKRLESPYSRPAGLESPQNKAMMLPITRINAMEKL